MFKTLICMAGLGLLASNTFAADVEFSESYQQCMNSAISTPQMHACIGAETKQQDTRLNLAYNAARSGLDRSQQKQLQDVQRKWMAYRDGNCAFYGNPKGGSIASVNAGMCLLEMTSTRADELENLSKVP